MAGLSQDKRSSVWFVYFRYGGKAFNRSTGTTKRAEAEKFAHRVEERLGLLDRGLIEVPPDADFWEWLKSDGKRTTAAKVESHVKLADIFKQFFDGLPPSTAVEQGDQNWRDTQRLHTEHFLAVMGNLRLPLLLSDWQEYIGKRSRGAGKKWAGKGQRRAKLIAKGTVKKELDTVRMVYNRWAREAKMPPAPTDKDLIYPSGAEKQPFMTWEQIEARVQSGGVSEADQTILWDALYLDPKQVAEVLSFVAEKRKQRADFFHPLLFTAAATGARASELRRALRDDFNFATRQVTLRERKKQAGEFTLRHVPISAKLADVMQDWFARHPGGRFAFCRSANVKLKHRSLMKTFEACFRSSKWKVLRGLHMFRHSFASNLACLEVDQRRIDEWMGHQTEAMRKRYQHLRPIRVNNPVDLLVE